MADDKSDAADLVEIRQEFSDATDEWADARKEGAIDMRYVAGDPWDPTDRKARKDSGQPVVAFDELGQYVNQLQNDVRQNKRGIRVSPEGAGADSKTAEHRENRIRQLEYKSNAQQAYTTMFDNTVQRSYGFLRIVAEYASHRSTDQELRIKAIPNPNMVTPDPYHLSPDGSDWKFLYFGESYKIADFKRKYPNAKVQSFGADEMRDASQWIAADRITVAERWTVRTKPRQLVMFEMPAPQAPGGTLGPLRQGASSVQGVFEDEKAKLQQLIAQGGRPLTGENAGRIVDYPYVKQQILNGIEILDEEAWPGCSIPFVACYGKVLYVDLGAGPKRKLLSLVRLARDPYLAYCYLATLEMQSIATTLKFPYFAYEGQLTVKEEQKLTQSVHEPIALIKVKPMVDGVPLGSGPLPFPQRTFNQVDIQALEIAKESCRRAIQAAMGSAPLPTDAQKRNDKSGVALEKIEDSAQRGSYHMIDSYDWAVTRTGAIINEVLEHYEDNVRTVTTRKQDDTPIQVRINDQNDPKSVMVAKGEHDVTISVGPAVISERAAASEFADAILGSPFLKAIEPAKIQQLIALAIKLKAVGPLGDEMAEIINPKQDDGEISPEMVGQLKQRMQMLEQQLQQAMQEIQTGAAKEKIKAGAAFELQKLVFQKELALKVMDNAAKIRVAEITATKETVHAAFEDETEAIALAQQHAHEAMQAQQDRAHELAMAAVGQQQALDAGQQEHQQGLEAGDVAHRQALEQGDAGHQQQLEQQANQAALAPPETEA